MRAETLDQRRLLAGDVQVRFEFVDANQNPVTSLSVGEDFVARAFVQDIQSDPSGVSRSYFDVNFDASLATAQPPITHGGSYNLAPDGNLDTPGLIDEVGGSDTDNVPPTNAGDEFLLFSVPLTANAPGTLQFTLDSADMPSRSVQLFDLREIPGNEVDLVNASIPIGAGIVISPTSGLQTTEAGGTATFTAVMTTQPTANVSFTLTSSDPDEGTINRSSVTFTSANWNVPQTIIVSGVDDDRDDDDQAYQIVTTTTSSTDPTYQNLTVADVSVVNLDNDTFGFIVNPLSGLVTNELGQTDTFTVRLRTRPATDVRLGVSVNDPTEASLNVNELVFTPQNWQTPQTVTVTGVADDIDDGNVNYQIQFSPASGGDPQYTGNNPPAITAVNTDVDTAGITVAPTSGLITSESGTAATFEVVLTSRPTDDVRIDLNVSDTSEGTLLTDQLIFTPQNWNVRQPVTVTGVNDDLADGNMVYSIVTSAAISADPQYNNRVVADVMATNTDDDVAAVVIAPTSGLVTSENGGAATFTARLTARPSSDVTITLMSSDTGEGTVDRGTLTFTPANFDTEQTVTISGVDDSSADGDVEYTIITANAVSADASFNNMPVDDISVTNVDNDNAGIVIAPIDGLVISESGTSDSFQVRLSSQPVSNVTIGVRSGNLAEGTVDVTQLVFSPQNWDVNQTVTITGVDDSIDDGGINFLIVTDPATSNDPAYNGLDAVDVSVTNEDDDVAGVIVVPISGLQTSETGGTANFSISLASQPSAPVTVDVVSSNTAEGVVSLPNVTFDATNWNVPQTITITGVDDQIDDGDVNYTIETSVRSTDPRYANLDPDDVLVVNLDNDEPGISITPTSGLVVDEDGQSDSFDIVLTSQPAANVTINLASSDPGEVQLSVDSVTFTPANWDIPQTVSATGVDDAVVDGSVDVTIQTAPAISSDSAFAGIDPVDVVITNNDNDTATLSIADVSVLEGTGDAPSQLTFNVVLATAVNQPFSVDFATSDQTAIAADGDYVANTGTLNFAGQAGEVQTITVDISPDSIVEANETLQIILSNVVGLTGDFDGRVLLPTQPAIGTIENDDTATLSIIAPIPTFEGTGTDPTPFTFTIQLSGQVQGGFTLPYFTDDGTATLDDNDYIDADGTLTFAGDDGETQTVVVSVVADDQSEIDEDFTFRLGDIGNTGLVESASIAGGNASATATIVNDDGSQLVISNVTVSNLEGSDFDDTTEFRFEVRLTDSIEDADGFEVPFTTVDGTAVAADGDYQSTTGVLSFAGTEGETQIISVLVNHDQIVESNEMFSITLGAISGLQEDQTVLILRRSLSATIVNDDTANLQITAAPTTIDEGGSYEVTVTLDAEVQDGFSIDYVTADGTATAADNDFVPSSNTLTFNGTSGEAQTFTVQSVEDETVEQDQTFNVILQNIAGLPDDIINSIIVDGPLQLTIANDDNSTITLTGPATMVEGDDGSVDYQFDVTLSNPIDGVFSIDYQTIDGTAIGGSDFVATNGTLVFDETTGLTQSIFVTVNGDTIVEGDEAFQLTISSPTFSIDSLQNNVTLQNTSVMAVIQNDDQATLSIVGPGTIDEGTFPETTTATFTVTLSAAVQDGFSVDFQTVDGTATVADDDYSPQFGTLSFAGDAGETQTITVDITADQRFEADETFSVVLAMLSGLPEAANSAVAIDPDTAVATVANDDFARLIVTNTTVANNEGTSDDGFTDFTFDVTLTDAVQGPDGFMVPISINDGTASASDGDYIDNDVVLQFDGNAMETRTVTVRVRQDNVLESDETFSVDIGAIIGLADGEVVNIEEPSTEATIIDDDSATLTLMGIDVDQNEGDGGGNPYRFDVNLSAPVQAGFSINYSTVDQSATSDDNDYEANVGTLDFAGLANETQTITVIVNGDTTVEMDETFLLTLGDLLGLDPGVIDRLTINNATETATIRNDDTASLSIIGPGVLSEGTLTNGNPVGTTAFTFTVRLDNAVAGGFDIAYQTDSATAVSPEDFGDDDGMLSFVGDAGETQTITVLVNADAIVENDETFSLTLGQISAANDFIRDLIMVDTMPVVATIQNDDTATVAFDMSSSEVLELDGQALIPVRLTVTGGGTISQPVTVNVVVRDGGTASAADFTLATTSITFAAGSRDGDIQNVAVTLIQDGIEEEIETVVVALEMLNSELAAIDFGAQTVHTLSIVDDARNAVVSGRVWVDSDNDGDVDIGELTIPSVSIMLTGTTLGGMLVSQQTATDDNGYYSFTGLSAGTYSITQTQPSEFVDGLESLGTVNGLSRGMVGNDQFTDVQIRPSQVAVNYSFGERGLAAAQVNRFRILARPRTTTVLGNPITFEMLSPTVPVVPTTTPSAARTSAVNHIDAALQDEQVWQPDQVSNLRLASLTM